MVKDALVVNLFAGPGTGKSTTAALLFGKLKVAGYNTEYVSEYAKDLVWEERTNALAFQPYVSVKQIWRQHRLRDKVDIIITDSPILLGMVYKGDGYTNNFGLFLRESFEGFNNVNFFLERNPEAHPWNQAGRGQTEAEAMQIDAKIRSMLLALGAQYRSVAVMDGEQTADFIRDTILIDSVIESLKK